jgi:glutamate synthase (NADPH/NADH) small chain
MTGNPDNINTEATGAPPKKYAAGDRVGPDGLTNKERIKIKRHDMPEQPPLERVRNFNSVVLGYTPEIAYEEAQRCLDCPVPKCIDGCPAEIDIPGFIREILKGNLDESYRILKQSNALPAVCGRVCPQEAQCEKTCLLVKKGPVAIGRLEQFVAETILDCRLKNPQHVEPIIPTKEKVAVVGAGPAGITAAMDLMRMGYDVTMFEALHKPGGVLNYGIPPFRLPRRILNAELDTIGQMGVPVHVNRVFGKTITYEELIEDGYKAIFLGTGAGLPSFMGVPGENANGVYSSNEYLTRVNLMEAWDFPNADTPVFVGKTVVTVGAGNTAMDSARVSLRMPGVEKSYIVYRRSRDEAPARHEELEHAEQEGVIFQFLTQPIEVLRDENNWVKGMKCLRMELGEPDDSGRRRPVPVPDSEFVIDCQTILVAIGQRPNPIAMNSIKGLEISRWGTIVVNEQTMMTSVPGVFAGGDATVGASTVIMAVGQGKIAARNIDAYLDRLRNLS